ncbi:MAG: apolipoprotein N-acyltransferase [Holosporaceae bacterium]|jgi:apolipoprotein N-acyltransferase|nr:apolipoprotein N-acyltransferase [Holosporaceae bacterium]
MKGSDIFFQKFNNRFFKSGFWGAITAFSFAPFNIFPIFLATFAGLFARIRDGGKSSVGEAFCFFFCLHAACLYWVIYPLTFNMARHWVLIPFTALIPAFLSAFLILPIVCMRRCLKKVVPYAMPFVFALLFTFTMWFYGDVFPGFPWILPGYIWCCHEIFLQTLSVYGIYGLSFATLLIAGFLGLSFGYYESNDSTEFRSSAAIAAFLLLFMTLFGHFRLKNHPTEFTNKKIKVVQCNINQRHKNDPYFAFLNLKEHLARSSHESPLDFIIWPEASVPYLYREDFRQLNDRLKSILKCGEYLAAGAVRRDTATGKIHNSVIVLDHDGKNIANHDKFRLLPFGEYIPFREYMPFQSIAGHIGDFDAGERRRIVELGGLKIIFAICYEIAFPDDFSGAFSLGGEGGWKEADLIVNVTNDGWFGFTTEPFQHLQISRARAVETGLPLVRATNYGISAVFDPCGREIARIPIDQTGVIEINVPKKIEKL